MTRPTPIFLLDSQGSDLTTWIAVSIGVMGLLYLLLRKGKKRDPLAGGPAFNLSQQRGVERQMESLLVELSNMSRQITAQLDTRATKLELLIKEADDRLLALGRALDNPPPRTPVPASVETGGGAPVPLQRLQGYSLPVAAPPREPPLDQRYAAVYSLADEGISSPDIARRLGQPTGEVELILALRPR